MLKFNSSYALWFAVYNLHVESVADSTLSFYVRLTF